MTYASICFYVTCFIVNLTQPKKSPGGSELWGSAASSEHRPQLAYFGQGKVSCIARKKTEFAPPMSIFPMRGCRSTYRFKMSEACSTVIAILLGWQYSGRLPVSINSALAALNPFSIPFRRTLKLGFSCFSRLTNAFMSPADTGPASPIRNATSNITRIICRPPKYRPRRCNSRYQTFGVQFDEVEAQYVAVSGSVMV